MTKRGRQRAVTGAATLAACFVMYLVGLWFHSGAVMGGSAVIFLVADSHFKDELRLTLWPWMRGDRRTFFPAESPPVEH